MPSRDRLRLIQHLFNDAAARHPRAVEPVLAPLYDDFVRYAAPDSADRVLDLGTGTGPIARRIAPHVRSVVGVDVAIQALVMARFVGATWPSRPGRVSKPAPPIQPGGEVYACADLHRLPFPARTFTLIAASFGLNAADPPRVRRELRRVLAPGGRIVIQEWGAITPLDQAVSDVFAGYTVTDPPPDLAALRAWIASDLAERQWTDDLQDADDYAEWLRDLGCGVIDAREYTPVTIQVSMDAFIAYALAGTERAGELRALDAPTRAACNAALCARLADFADSAGILRWQPVVIRAAGRLIPF